MYDIKEIRRENMRALAKVAGGVSYLATVLSKSQSQISQLIGKSPSKNIGDRIARQIEEIFKKPRGWMDVLHNHVDETITAFELVKSAAPHRPVPLISWDVKFLSIPLSEIYNKLENQTLIAANAKLSEKSFAIRISDVETARCQALSNFDRAIIVLDPAIEAYSGAYLAVLHAGSDKLELRHALVDGKCIYLRNENRLEEKPEDSNYAVVKQVIVDFD